MLGEVFAYNGNAYVGAVYISVGSDEYYIRRVPAEFLNFKFCGWKKNVALLSGKSSSGIIANSTKNQN